MLFVVPQIAVAEYDSLEFVPQKSVAHTDHIRTGIIVFFVYF